LFLADGGKSVQKILDAADEPIRPEMDQYGKASDRGVYDLWQLHLERNKLQKMYMDRWNACEGLDAILCKIHLLSYTLDHSSKTLPFAISVPQIDPEPLPQDAVSNMVSANDVLPGPTTPYASVEHTQFRHIGYTGIFNILDYSCLSFPCGISADQTLDSPPVDEPHLSHTDKEVQGTCMFLCFWLYFPSFLRWEKPLIKATTRRQPQTRAWDASFPPISRSPTGRGKGAYDGRDNPSSTVNVIYGMRQPHQM
jgi:hypothetical protein